MSVLSSVIPRNFVLQILAIFLFPWVIYKSIKEIFLVTNCIKRVFSILSTKPAIDILKDLNYIVFKVCRFRVCNDYTSVVCE